MNSDGENNDAYIIYNAMVSLINSFKSFFFSLSKNINNT